MSWGVSPRVNPVWDSLGFLDLGDYFLPHFRKVFNYYLLKYFLMVFLFVFFSWDSYNSNVGMFNIVPEVSDFFLISFIYLFIYFTFCFHSIFCLTYPIFCLLYSTIVSLQSVFYLIYWVLTLISSRSLLKISCILSILVSRLFICNSILFSRFWIIFTIIILNYFQVDSLSLPLLFGLVAIFPVPLPDEYFSAFSSCLYCCVCGGLFVF